MVRGSVVELDGRSYVVKGHMREPRFGIDEQPKYWVINTVDLESGETKILKTLFEEDFHVHIGILKIRCYRSATKESHVLELTRGDHRFMQGFTIYDHDGRNVRVLDFIRGSSLFKHIPTIDKSHELYFFEDLPKILRKLLDSIEAIELLHSHGLCHGDIRNDHILIDSETGKFRWIDFDLKQDVTDFDMWSIGNIINYVVAKGILTFKNTLKQGAFPVKVQQSLRPEDGSAFYEYRIMNLGKVFPYLPDSLSDMLCHFTRKPVDYYTSFTQFADQYRKMLADDFPC